MTYFGFLIRFLLLPIVLLGAWHWTRRRAVSTREEPWRGPRAAMIIALHVVLALAYTTPWDNYLVATGVWWYDPALVSGVTIGWVPIEEYTFFVLQPILSGMLLLALMRRLLPQAPFQAEQNRSLRRGALAGAGFLWLLSLLPLLFSWQPGTYLALELGWALPPIMLQLAYGADLLWHYRRPLLPAVLLPTAYLAAADALAIESGVWTISPEQSLHWLVAGILPLEEVLFFLLTNTLVIFGVTLSLAPESRARMRLLLEKVKSARPRSRSEQRFSPRPAPYGREAGNKADP